MHLIDCFIELFGYVSYMNKALPGEQPGFDRVKTDIAQLITRNQAICQSSAFSREDFELAQFAVFAWIDETILNSSWQEKNRWQSEQLQRTYFQTADAGELFFDKLNTLQPHQTQVREVYYVCLSLGFTGRYCNPGDEILLTQLRSSNLKLLAGAGFGQDGRAADILFPEGYQDGDAPDLGPKRKFFNIGTLVGGGVPVALLLFLFGVYRFVLNNVGENLINSIR